MFGAAGGKVSGCCFKVAWTDKGVLAAIRIGESKTLYFSMEGQIPIREQDHASPPTSYSWLEPSLTW